MGTVVYNGVDKRRNTLKRTIGSLVCLTVSNDSSGANIISTQRSLNKIYLVLNLIIVRASFLVHMNIAKLYVDVSSKFVTTFLHHDSNTLFLHEIQLPIDC